jgi:hypothetical protein
MPGSIAMKEADTKLEWNADKLQFNDNAEARAVWTLGAE